MENKLRRDDRITMTKVDNFNFEVSNKRGKVLDSDDNYFIYFKNVNFRQDGTIEGRYLGTTSDGILDNYCQNVSYDEGKGYNVLGRKVRTARLVALNNKLKVVIIVSND